MFFDTHAHYDSSHFDEDRDEVIKSLNLGGVDLVIDPGCDYESSLMAVKLSEKYPFIYAAVGWHPEDMDKLQDDSLEKIKELAKRPKTVAIGEIGLDYYWDKEHKEEQKVFFEKQIEMALELDLPIIVHDREAHGDSLEIVRKYPSLRGVFHCYSGSVEMAEILLKDGWYLGFDGPITYKNAKKQIEVLEMVPTDRMLIETDSPYLTPVPFRGKRNDSRMLKYVVEQIANVKGMDADEVARITMENGKKLFGI